MAGESALMFTNSELCQKCSYLENQSRYSRSVKWIRDRTLSATFLYAKQYKFLASCDINDFIDTFHVLQNVKYLKTAQTIWKLYHCFAPLCSKYD